jgi:hypothetical protein
VYGEAPSFDDLLLTGSQSVDRRHHRRQLLGIGRHTKVGDSAAPADEGTARATSGLAAAPNAATSSPASTSSSRSSRTRSRTREFIATTHCQFGKYQNRGIDAARQALGVWLAWTKAGASSLRGRSSNSWQW